MDSSFGAAALSVHAAAFALPSPDLPDSVAVGLGLRETAAREAGWGTESPVTPVTAVSMAILDEAGHRPSIPLAGAAGSNVNLI